MLVILLLNQQMLYEAEQIVVILWAHRLFIVMESFLFTIKLLFSVYLGINFYMDWDSMNTEPMYTKTQRLRTQRLGPQNLQSLRAMLHHS